MRRDIRIIKIMNEVEKTINIKIADKVIEIRFFSEQVEKICRNYLAESMTPDVVVRVPKDELVRVVTSEANRVLPVKQLFQENVAVVYNYSDLESMTIYQKIADFMLDKNVLLVHGAAIAVNNKCYIFTAPSGTGKTTHIMNWCKVMPDTVVINGDKPLVDVENAIVYGTPWCGKEGLNTNMSVPLAGIISLERGITNSIGPISFREMLPIYLQQVYISKEQDKAMQAYQLIGKLKNIPCYRLICNMDEESAVVAYSGLCGE